MLFLGLACLIIEKGFEGSLEGEEMLTRERSPGIPARCSELWRLPPLLYHSNPGTPAPACALLPRRDAHGDEESQAGL